MAETTQSIARKSGRWIYLLGILAFIAYAAWIMGPYLQSIIVRDAAVTTWLNRSSSPIDGTVERISVSVGRMVGAGGVIVQIENEHLSRQPLTEAEIHVDLARERVEELQNFLEEIKSLDRERAELKGHYADTFRAELDVQIASLRREIKVSADRLALMRKDRRAQVDLGESRTGFGNRGGRRSDAGIEPGVGPRKVAGKLGPGSGTPRSRRQGCFHHLERRGSSMGPRVAHGTQAGEKAHPSGGETGAGRVELGEGNSEGCKRRFRAIEQGHRRRATGQYGLE